MSILIDVFLPLALLGLLIHLLRQYANPATPLPSHRLTHRQPLESGWKWEYTPPTISIYTKGFNNLPQSLLSEISSGRIKLLSRIYDIGAIAGGIGGIVAFGGLVWATMDIWRTVWRDAEMHASWTSVEQGMEVVKRSLGLVEGVGERANRDVGPSGFGQSLLPLVSILHDYNTVALTRQIPGITMPFSHVPSLVLGLVVNQLFHEFGHAICAGL
jgi:S2P endopeptidase